MPILHIDLQEGFSKDEALMEVDGREVFHEQKEGGEEEGLGTRRMHERRFQDS